MMSQESTLPFKAFLLVAFSLPAFSMVVFGETAVAAAKPRIEASQSLFRFTGTITSEREAAISPRVAGLVAKADAEMGHTAEAGEILVSLDDTLAQMDLQEKQLNLEAAKTELANAKRRLDEAIDLGDENFPRSEREDRETTFKMAQIAVKRLETVVNTQKEILERHQILAPFDGTVIEKRAEVGEWVQTGNPVLRFVDTYNLRLDIEVPQEQLNLILNATSVTVQIAGANGMATEGHIEARSPKVDPQTRTFNVRIQLDDPPSMVKPGMSAEAVFKPKSNDSQLFILRDAILRAADGRTQVWVAEQTGRKTLASSRTIKLGASSGDLIEVLSGLEPSDLVIYQGNESLQQGQEILIANSVIPATR